MNFSKNFKNSLLFSLGNYIFQFSSVITNIFVNSVLGVTAAGAISYISAIDQNVDLLYSPIRSSLERELPVLLKNDKKKSQVFIETSFLFSYLLILLGSFIYLYIYLTNENHYIKYAAIFFIFLNIFKSFASLIRIYHKSLLNFKYISFTLLLTAIIQPLVTIPLVNIYGYNGFFVGKIVISVITSILLVQCLVTFPKIKFKINFRILRHIYFIGFPLVIYSILSILIITIDKFFIEKYLSLKDLGLYSIGSMAFKVLLLLPISIYGTYYPKFIAKEGSQNNNIFIISKIVKFIMIFFIGFSWVLIYPALKIILPDFIASIKSVKILLIAFYYAGTYQMFYMDLIRKKKLMKVNLFAFLIVLLSIPLFWLATNYGNSIEWVALTTTLSFLLLSSVNIFLSQKEMNIEIKFIFKYLLINSIYLIPVLPMIIIDFFYQHDYSIFIESIKLISFLILLIPFIYNIILDKDVRNVVFSKS
jgi:O-antigen/teichoic acid export membrane protein